MTRVRSSLVPNAFSLVEAVCRMSLMDCALRPRRCFTTFGTRNAVQCLTVAAMFFSFPQRASLMLYSLGMLPAREQICSHSGTHQEGVAIAMSKKLKSPLRIRFLAIAPSLAVTTTVLGLSAYLTDTDVYQGTFRTALGDELDSSPPETPMRTRRSFRAARSI